MACLRRCRNWIRPMACLRRWRNWIRPFVVGVYCLVLMIVLPVMIFQFQKHGTASYMQAWFIGGLFVILAVPISLWGILQHLIHYNQPRIQKYIVRILWMVPIYAVNAWFGLRFKSLTLYLDTARECYEAYVIYNFISYLLTYLHDEHRNLEDVIAVKKQAKHFFPFCLLPNWLMGRTLIQNCKHGVLQYAVIRPLTTVVAFMSELGGVYGEGDFNFTTAWSYLVIINNISQIWAMYCLILFYRATSEELTPLRPVSKFLCVKAVIFLSFWQAVLIAALVKVGVIKESKTWVFYDIHDVANGLQDFCICIEMFLAAIAHYYSFSYKPYVDHAAGYANCCDSFMAMCDVSDVRDDVYEHVRRVGKKASNMVTRRGSEHTPLLLNASLGGAVGINSCPPSRVRRSGIDDPDDDMFVIINSVADGDRSMDEFPPAVESSRSTTAAADTGHKVVTGQYTEDTWQGTAAANTGHEASGQPVIGQYTEDTGQGESGQTVAGQYTDAEHTGREGSGQMTGTGPQASSQCNDDGQLPGDMEAAVDT